jgi:hypothetical protein
MTRRRRCEPRLRRRFLQLDRHPVRHQIGEAASRVATMPALRRALVEKQRAFAD